MYSEARWNFLRRIQQTARTCQVRPVIYSTFIAGSFLNAVAECEEAGFLESHTTDIPSAMLIKRQFKHLIAFLCPLLIILGFVSCLAGFPHRDRRVAEPLARGFSEDEDGSHDSLEDLGASTVLQNEAAGAIDLEMAITHTRYFDNDDHEAISAIPDRGNYRELVSLTTRNRKYISVWLDGKYAYNPSIIPHPTRYDMWVIIAQPEQNDGNLEEVVCTAGFVDDVLICESSPTTLPVPPSITGICEGELAYINTRPGPRDARIFYGPVIPYAVYGSLSQYTCLGLWMQDARELLEPFHIEQHTLSNLFHQSTELRRPAPWSTVEKNFFVFWDSQGTQYVHYDLWPKRTFAQTDFDGSAGDDLAPSATSADQVCMAKYMPHVEPEHEFIHQATNSLSITLCKRSDLKCTPDDSNTFLMHIFHHKFYYDFHSVYEPYVILFQRTAPFAIHAISQRPLWIYGRNVLTEQTNSPLYRGRGPSIIPSGHTEMFYVSSMSWRTHGQKYNGYIDDVLFLGFGIEDSRLGVIDVLAGALLQDLAFC